MYITALLVFMGLGVLLIARGVQERRRGRIALGASVALVTVLFFALMNFWGEMLWFRSLGYPERFWEVVLVRAGLALGAAIAGAALVFLLTIGVPGRPRGARKGGVLLAALIAGAWGAGHWVEALQFVHRVSTGVVEPILSRDAGFYLFTLPLLDSLVAPLYVLLGIALLIAVMPVLRLTRRGRMRWEVTADGNGGAPAGGGALVAGTAAMLLMLSFSAVLARFHTLYSSWGAVSGPGWTDVHIRLPMLAIVSVIALALAVVVAVPPLRALFDRAIPSRLRRRGPARFLAAVGIVMAGAWLVLLALIPGLVQWLRVEPNEITFEAPYIAHNIEFTRRAFGLHEIEEREFPVTYDLSRQTVERNSELFANVRLWDWRALDAVYKQFQEIRLYYEFIDVDIDRYNFGGAYRQVMVSARELDTDNLPAQSQTFVNKRFKYTHGQGITLTNVSEFTPQGLPNLLVKDIPPHSAYPELEVMRPEIYYGELTYDPVIVNSREQEFDYPSGDENVYVSYAGQGGVEISNLWRKLLFGYKFDGTRLFLSGYPTRTSRMMFHREIRDRVQTIAPFLYFDDDPYVVLADGRLYWIVDAYTTSHYYPYSEPFSSIETIDYRGDAGNLSYRAQTAGYLHDANYIRNSVKVVVDAYNGDVDFYIYDDDDPLIRVWDAIFPELFQPRESMPEALRNHVRYPVDLLLVQGLVYTKYHMTDPAVFYNQEDLWIRATEKYYSHVQPVEPYYVMWQPPESDSAEFTLILPFTPKRRQVLIGWIAGMCDGDNYGRFIAYKFPKEQRVLGPQQVETKIDQDRFLSGQLTLWDQRGSRVIRGNVLAIPIENTLLYVEPIYLQAETAAYPELRLVAVMHGDNLSYAQTFGEALEGLLEGGGARIDLGSGEGMSTPQLIERANAAFEDYLDRLGEKKFEEAAQALSRLQDALSQLSSGTAQAPANEAAGGNE